LPKISEQEFDWDQWNHSLTHKCKPHVWVKGNVINISMIKKWLDENIEGKYYYTLNEYNRDHRVWFDKVEDATYFKMVWG